MGSIILSSFLFDRPILAIYSDTSDGAIGGVEGACGSNAASGVPPLD
jgi:hypothetical protein